MGPKELALGALGAILAIFIGFSAGSNKDVRETVQGPDPAPVATSTPSTPFGQTPGIAPCKTGWQDTSTSDRDTVVFSCQRRINDVVWTVYRHADGTFSHAWKDGAPAFEYDESKVPQW